MPDILIWTGAADSDPTNLANYLKESSGALIAATAVPANGDTLILGEATNPLLTGQSGVNLALLEIKPTYVLNAGSAAAPLAYGTVTLLEVDTGGPSVHLNATVTTANVTLRQGRRLVLTGGSIGTLKLGSGVVEAGTAAITTLLNDSGRVVLGQSGTRVTTAINARGRVQSTNRNIGIYDGGPGSVLETIGTSSIDDGSNSGRATLEENASWMMRGSIATHDELYAKPRSIADASAASYDQTITDATIWTGARINETNAGSNVVFTNTPTYIGSGQTGTALASQPFPGA